MNIGEVARRSGVRARTIRYYESIGLVRPRRNANGYRVFGDSHLRKLELVARARSLGFTVRDCRALLALDEDGGRASADVKRLATDQLARIDRKIAGLRGMRGDLGRLVAHCNGDARPECPILDGLAGGSAAGVSHRRLERAGTRSGDRQLS